MLLEIDAFIPRQMMTLLLCRRTHDGMYINNVMEM